MRGRRDQAVLPLEQPVRVKLTDDDRAAKGHQMAVKRLALRAVKRDLKRHTRGAKEELARLEKEIDDLADALVFDEEIRKQGDLRLEGKTEATPILATVAQVAEGKAPPKSALPSEAHTFVPDRKGDGTCFGCGSSKADPVHGTAAATAGNGKASTAPPKPQGGRGARASSRA
jgi:hypothetical protein